MWLRALADMHSFLRISLLLFSQEIDATNSSFCNIIASMCQTNEDTGTVRAVMFALPSVPGKTEEASLVSPPVSSQQGKLGEDPLVRLGLVKSGDYAMKDAAACEFLVSLMFWEILLL